MALTSPALTLAVEAMFGNIKPALDIIDALGPTDFSDGAPGVDVKPGATIKVPLSTVGAAQAFNASSNNYLTGGDTDWATLTASHYLQGYDVSGVNLDQGVNAARIRQLFAKRCGSSIAMAARAAIVSALDGATASTGVKIAASPTLAQYDALASACDWFNPAECVLVLNGAEWVKVKGVLHGSHLSASPQSAAEELGFKRVVVLPTTGRAFIVPFGSMGFISRVPQIVADYKEHGTETDPDSGLSVGIVVADEQSGNRIVVNGDLWFGAALLSANAAATTPGVVKVGTAT